MSSARSRARTVHGRTPKTSTQLVDEMSTSKDFQSPDIFALRRRQAQVDAAKRGVSRLRRASVRMSDLTSVIDLDSSNDMNDASPRKRAESSGSLFGGSDEEEETGGRNYYGGDRRRSFVSQKAFDLLELELQEKQMELKLAAEIGQMLLEKEQTMSERCAAMDVEQTRLKTELHELDNENQVLHRKFSAAQKKSKDFQNENLKLSEEIRILETETNRLKVLADENEKMRSTLNGVNLQLITLKNENRKIRKQKRDSPAFSRLQSASTLSNNHFNNDGGEGGRRLAYNTSTDGSRNSGNDNNNKSQNSDEKHDDNNNNNNSQLISREENNDSIAGRNLKGNNNEEQQEERLQNHNKMVRSLNHTLKEKEELANADDSLLIQDDGTELNRSSTSVDMMYELDHLRDENQLLQKSGKKLMLELQELKVIFAENDERLDQQTIELNVAKTHAESMHKEVLRLERESREDKEMIKSLRDTLEEYKMLLDEHDYSNNVSTDSSMESENEKNSTKKRENSTNDNNNNTNNYQNNGRNSNKDNNNNNKNNIRNVNPTMKKSTLSRNMSIGDDVGFLKSEIEKLKHKNQKLSREMMVKKTTNAETATIISKQNDQKEGTNPKPPLIPKLTTRTTSTSISKDYVAVGVSAPMDNDINSNNDNVTVDKDDQLTKHLQSKIEEIMHIKNELLEKEMDVLRYKKIAIEWRKTMKPSFIVTATALKEEGFTMYKIILVHHNGAKHEIEKRYSHFLKFYQELERTLFVTDAYIRLPKMPPKVWGRSRSMARSVINKRRGALKDFLTVMVALTEANGEIAEAFWKFLEFAPPERDKKILSFHSTNDEEK